MKDDGRGRDGKEKTVKPTERTDSAKDKAKGSKRHKYIFVVGGVMSGVGKGIATSSIGTLLHAKGYDVNLAKVDPYLNVDAGTMNPTEHGEVFVLNSGLETDQDMGNYERFLDRDLTHDDYMTSGMVYRHVIEKERALGYRGRCVEAIPDIRDEIVRRYERGAEISGSEISVIEIGGTVGDYQNIMFIEAARVLKIRHPDDVIFIMVSYLPIPSKIGEMKSRPTQNAVRQLASYGVHTDILICRADVPIDKKRKEKIALSCSVPVEHVISAPDIDSVYDVPVNFERDHLSEIILHALRLDGANGKGGDSNSSGNGGGKNSNGAKSRGLGEWKKFAENVHKIREDKKVRELNIAIVGKYFNTGDFVLTDAYLSVLEAIKYSAYEKGVKPVIHTVNARDFEPDDKGRIPAKSVYKQLDGLDGIIVPGGFGETGIEGKLAVIRYAREKKIPYFGLCYGMQLLVIEYARNVLGLDDANTAEIDKFATHTVIDIMPEQKKKLEQGEYGASMRLGVYDCALKAGTIAEKAYKSAVKSVGWHMKDGTVKERHRHRYEVNPEYVAKLSGGMRDKKGKIIYSGLVFSGTSPEGGLMEIAELPESVHPFFLGTQFHPEFLARPIRPHPLFTAFVTASIKRGKGGRR